MTVEEAQEAAGVELISDGTDLGGCSYSAPAELTGVNFMVVNGEIARVGVAQAVVTTMSGLTLGASETEVIEEYGDNIERTQHEYVADGSYLTYVPDDPTDDARIVFETDGANVTLIRAGRLPEVGWIEGCA
jgi:hypothetical protein